MHLLLWLIRNKVSQCAFSSLLVIMIEAGGYDARRTESLFCYKFNSVIVYLLLFKTKYYAVFKVKL